MPATRPSAPTATTELLAKLIDRTRQACSAYDRSDLAARLVAAAELVRRPGTHVVVCGEFKQGKSSFVNALVNAPLCPVDDDIATAVPTFVRWGERSRLEVSTFGDDPAEEPGRQLIEFEDLRRHVVEDPDGNPLVANRVDIDLPRPILAGGLVIVDTPGVGGLGSAHATATLAAIPMAEAVVFVSDAAQEYTETEMGFLRQARELCPTVVCVLSKTDLYPAWRKIHDINKGHLVRAGIEAEILPISSSLRIESIRLDDDGLGAESGFPAVEELLTAEVAARSKERAMGNAVAELLAVVRLLAAPFEGERAALSDPATAQALVDDLAAAQGQAERLRSGAARWNITLGDGITDLMADVDHDFKSRIRRLLDEAHQAIDDHDPSTTWSEFEPWLQARVSAEVVANYGFLQERSTELTELVAEHFQDGSGDVVGGLPVFDPKPALSDATSVGDVEFLTKTAVGRAFGAVRGGQSGLFMFRTFSGFVLKSMNPMAAPMVAVSLAAGLLTGQSSMSEEKKRELTQHRAQAKAAVRKYTDDISFTVTRDLQTTMRRIQRDVRDHYTERAEELMRSTSEAVTAAQRAAQQGRAENEARLRDVEAELARLAALEESIESAGAGLAGHS